LFSSLHTRRNVEERKREERENKNVHTKKKNDD
jgi:hypothetical protein